MCVIIAGTAKKPSLEVLEACEKANGHGTGLAWVTRSGDVNYAKGLKPQAMHKILEGLTDGRPWAAHFRLATVGGQVDELAHPFPILDGVPLLKDGRAPKVLFHNGHWSRWMEEGLKEVLRWGVPPLKGHVSDSRVVALLVHHYGEDVLTLLPGKYVVLDKEGFRIWPYNRSEGWVEIDGVWYSNKKWSYRCPSSGGSYVGASQGCIGFGRNDHGRITGGEEVYDQKQKWLDRFSQAGYTQKDGMLVPPKEEKTIKAADPDHDKEMALVNSVLKADEGDAAAVEKAKAEMIQNGYSPDPDGWWSKRLGNHSRYRVWPRWQGNAPASEETRRLPPHPEGL